MSETWTTSYKGEERVVLVGTKVEAKKTKPVPPAAGKHCDTVEGMVQIGGGYVDPAQQAQQARPPGSN